MTDIHAAFFPGHTELTPVLMLHGTGGDESDLLPIATFLFPQHPKLGIRGRINENGSNRYFVRHTDGTFDLDSLSHETDWLLEAIQTKTTEHHLDTSRLIVLGFSNGANVAAYAMLHKTVPFKRAVLLHPMLIDPAESVANLADTRVFASYGDVDPIVSESNFDALTTQLTAQQANVEPFKNHQSHHLTQAELLAAKDWLAGNA